jgi:aromatic amino acid aminotransferase I / 2-aminoadipate transaminase
MAHIDILCSRRAIYNLACMHDLIIIEDDAYGMLYMGESMTTSSTLSESADRRSTFLSSLPPSYLSIDTNGRVVRLDTFSKYFFPGSRLGWATAHKTFAERLLRHGETSTRMPAGLSQAAVIATVVGSETKPGWGIEGWLDWIIDLRDLYRGRRDVLMRQLDALRESPRGSGRISYRTPTCGMFVVVHIDFASHRRFSSSSNLLGELFKRCVDGPQGKSNEGVLVVPGRVFAASVQEHHKANFVRMTYAYASENDMKTAIERFGLALDDVWRA